MDNKLKIVFILSSLGGPKLLRSLFSKGYRTDVVYIIYQQMPSSEFMDTLVQCLREDLPLPIHYITEEETALSPGHLYFVCNSYRYQMTGTLIKGEHLYDEIECQKCLDEFLNHIQEQDHQIGVVALSGVLIEKDGVQGIKKIKENGGTIVATDRSQAPVNQMIEELFNAEVLDEEAPAAELLDRIKFQDLIESPSEIQINPESDLKWLVVDDEEDVRGVIGDILELENISCDFASDGLDALRKIQKNHYGAMLLDIKMPELDGLQTLHALQTVDPTIPTLIVTGYDDKDTRKAAQKYSNVLGILLKPFMSEDLKAYLPRLLVRTHQLK